MIRTIKHDNVAEHFYSENHSVNDFMVIGIEKVFLVRDGLFNLKGGGYGFLLRSDIFFGQHKS
jgi:hypothetical protein